MSKKPLSDIDTIFLCLINHEVQKPEAPTHHYFMVQGIK